MRVFVAPSDLVAGELAIRGDEHHYLGRARRAAVGDALELVDGEGRRARATITRMTDAETIVRVEPPELIVAAPPFVRVLLPLIKGDRMDLALEKLVEVGADAIVVWPAARSVVKLEPDRRDARIAKYQLAVQAAARQSGRAQVPVVSWADSLSAAIAGTSGVKLVLDPSSDAPLPEVLASASEHAVRPTGDHALAAVHVVELAEVTIASGPEGGLAPEERALLGEFTAVGLGPRVLRAETAPVAAVAIVRAQTRS